MDLTNFEDKIPPKKATQADAQQKVEEIRTAVGADHAVKSREPELFSARGRWRTTVEVKDGYNSINESGSRPKVEVIGNVVRISAAEFELILSSDNILSVSIHQA
jgi:hypothetical protein